jgi:hypothetical protein
MQERNLILLTGTIDPTYFNDESVDEKINVVLIDPKERLAQYENVISRMIQESAYSDIVFIENTNHYFNSDKYMEMAAKAGKSFECIRHILSREDRLKLRQLGKSYGEAALIDYAIKNSDLIARVDEIYKITGRVFLKNSAQVVKGKKSCPNQIVSKNKMGWCNTEFFKVNKADYLTHLSMAMEFVNDHSEESIERIYYRLAKKSGMRVKSFPTYPLLSGRVASTVSLTYDQTGWILWAYRILNFLGYFNLK